MAIQKRYYIVTWFMPDIGKDWVVCDSLDEAVSLYDEIEKKNAKMLCIGHIVKNSIIGGRAWRLLKDNETTKEK